jgi:hypothetical protein
VTEIDVEITVPLEDLIDAGIDPKDRSAVERFAKEAGADALASSRFNFSTSHPTFTVNVQEGGVWGIIIEFDSGFQRVMERDEVGDWVDSASQ